MIMVIKKNNMGFLVGFTMAYTMIAKIIIRAKKPSNRCRIVLRCFIGSDQKAALAHAVKNRLYWSHIGRKIIKGGIINAKLVRTKIYENILYDYILCLLYFGK